MARYAFNEGTVAGAKLRKVLDGTETLLHAVEDIVGDLNQMSNAQATATYSFSDGVASPDDTTAGAAKSELLSDLGKLLSNASQTHVNAALRQMLDQFV